MPKHKTKKSAMKRFKLTGSGKIKRKKAFASHLQFSKTKKRKRGLRKTEIVRKEDEKRVLYMITA
jgi:large subunit ribosomal protein L35